MTQGLVSDLTLIEDRAFVIKSCLDALAKSSDDQAYPAWQLLDAIDFATADIIQAATRLQAQVE
jgi:hypothetical protein